MQKKSNEFQKVGGSKKAQLLYKKGLKYYISMFYLSINQYFRSVAFCCVLVAFPMKKTQPLRCFLKTQKTAQLFGVVAEQTQPKKA